MATVAKINSALVLIRDQVQKHLTCRPPFLHLLYTVIVVVAGHMSDRSERPRATVRHHYIAFNPFQTIPRKRRRIHEDTIRKVTLKADLMSSSHESTRHGILCACG